MRIATFAGLVVGFVGLSVPAADAQDPQPAPQVYHSRSRYEDRVAADAQEPQSTTQVLVRVKLIEASRTRLQRLGFDFAEVRGGRVSRYHSLADAIFADFPPSPTPEQKKDGPANAARSTNRLGIVQKQDKGFSVLKALEKDGLARVLAAPMVVTVSGRPSYFQVGAEIPVGSPGEGSSSQVEQKFVGTRMDIVPTVLEGGRIRLEVRLRVTEVAPTPTPLAASRQNPALRTWAVDTAVEMQSGHTAILGGMVQKRLVTKTVTAAAPAGQNHDGGAAPPTQEVTEPEEFECLVLIAPEIVDPKGPILTATPDALGEWADFGPAKQ
jgi:pilus assembly protein CpaC